MDAGSRSRGACVGALALWVLACGGDEDPETAGGSSETAIADGSSTSSSSTTTSGDGGASGSNEGSDEGADEGVTSSTSSSEETGADDTDAGTDTGGAGGAMVFGEVDGILAVEAEHFVTNDDLGTPRAWYLTTTRRVPGVEPDPDPSHADVASSAAYLEALPDTRVTHDDPIQEGESIFNNVGTGPTLSYRVEFQTAGTYVVWVRAYSTGGEDNGIHVGIDGQWPDSGERVQFCSGKNQWTWSSAQRDSDGPCGVNGTITIEVDAPGEHVITFSMREDGFEFDKWIMALDPEFVPEGEGPPENPLE